MPRLTELLVNRARIRIVADPEASLPRACCESRRTSQTPSTGAARVNAAPVWYWSMAPPSGPASHRCAPS